jgi:alkylated DNA repair dioxygenase AlkB
MCAIDMTEAPQGLRYIEEFLTHEKERALIAALETLDSDGRGVFRRRGQVVRRRELDFLHAYSRDRRQISDGVALPAFLESLRFEVAAFVGIAPDEIGQIITALYRPGAGIDWHTDAVRVFGNTICSVSLGSACTMQFRCGDGRPPWNIRLEPRSLLIMQGPARWDYKHRILTLKQLRYSVTLRTLQETERGRLVPRAAGREVSHGNSINN